MLFLTGYILKWKLRFATWKIRLYKIRNLFFSIYFFFLLVMRGILSPRKSFSLLVEEVNNLDFSLVPYYIKSLNLKIALVVAVFAILIGGGWAAGGVYNTGANAQGETEAEDTMQQTGLRCYMGYCDLEHGVLPDMVLTLNTALQGLGEGKLPDSFATAQDKGEYMKQAGVAGVAVDLVSLTYAKKPVSSSAYIADMVNRVNPNQKAYAQEGAGYKYLAPIFPIWAVFRNIALSFIALILVIFAFMILLGQKVGSLSITVQNSIPQVILAVILILFSYPLVGLMIDVAEVGNALVYNLFNPDPKADTYAIRNEAGLPIRDVKNFNSADDPLNPFGDKIYVAEGENHPTNIFSLMQELNKTENVQNAIKDVIQEILASMNSMLDDAGKAAGGLIGGVVSLILMLAVVSAMFKTFFGLLSAYVGVIIKTVVAPIQLLFVALPGGSTFTSWLKGILADVLVFPATFGLFAIAAVLMGDILTDTHIWRITSDLTNGGSFGWYPMPLGKFFDTTKAVSPTEVLASMISFGIILFAPSIPGIIKNALKTQDMTGGATSQVAGQLKGIASQVPFVGGFVR